MDTTNKNGKKAGFFSPFEYVSDNAGRGPARVGLFVLIPMLAALIVWSVLAPLNSAAVALGEVVLSDKRKTVQHLEGGMIEEIFVEEGQTVHKGDNLVAIRDISQRAQLNTLYDQLVDARAIRARLWAEYKGMNIPNFSSIGDNIDVDADKLKKVTALQLDIFNKRKETLDGKTGIIQSSKEQARKEMEALRSQLAATEKQYKYVTMELSGVTALEEKGLATITRKMELQKAQAELAGKTGAIKANIAKLRQTLLAGDLQIIDTKNEMENTILDELQKITLSIRELNHQILSIKDEIKRRIVKAPSSGRVLDLQVHTEGAVIAPGQKILDIVPQDDRLIVEAKLNPNDIDIVKKGINAKIMLSAYKAKLVPKLDGIVEDVSSDILTDEITGERYFSARVVVDETIFDKLKDEVELYPGMPAQVLMIEGERTVAQYLLSPITDAMYRSFREQ